MKFIIELQILNRLVFLKKFIVPMALNIGDQCDSMICKSILKSIGDGYQYLIITRFLIRNQWYSIFEFSYCIRIPYRLVVDYI